MNLVQSGRHGGLDHLNVIHTVPFKGGLNPSKEKEIWLSKVKAVREL